ncbi:MAG: DNA primase [Chloroflexi bacterium]|nr:DNA primase [Chloroflexota bacterium]
MSSIEEIKDRLDIVDVVSETVELRRSGKNHVGFCPFHANTRTPSFVVFPETGTWRCFGQCSEGGDIYKFVMKREGWDFPEALSHLAKQAGVQLRAPSPQEQAQKDEHARLRSLLEDAATYYRHQLVNTEAGKSVLEYLHKRGLNNNTIEGFGLGYAPDNWDSALMHFLDKGVAAEELLDVGLITKRDNGGYFDKFRHRVMFPIRDGRGRMTGFGARALHTDERAKYLNSPQTEVFEKSRLLYGLDRARKSIRDEDQVVIVEGYFDVIALHQAGYSNTVSPMGTALTGNQLRQLKRFSRRIVLALDSDAAGSNATLRGLQVAREAMDHESEPVFNPRGLLRHEARLQADIRVTILPDGKDPDDVVRESPEHWQEILDATRPIVIHVMESLAEGKDRDDPKVKTEIAQQVIPLIQDLPSAIERDTYLQRLARFLRVNEDTLLRENPRPRRRIRHKQAQDSPARKLDHPQTSPSEHISKKLELHSLGIIMRHPELLYRVDRALGEADLDRISSSDFQHTDHQVMFRLSLESLEQDYLEPVNFALDNLPQPLIDLADEILVRSEKLDPNEERVLEDLLRTILKLRRLTIHQGNEQLQFLQEEAQEGGDLQAVPYQQAIVSAVQTLNHLDKALGKYTGSPVTG